MKLYNQTINVALEIIGFVGMIIGEIYEKRYLMYICGFMCFFFSTCLCIDNVRRIKNKLGIINFRKTKKETNQYGYIEIIIFMVGCCLSVLLCKLNIYFDFLILLGALLGTYLEFY